MSVRDRLLSAIDTLWALEPALLGRLRDATLRASEEDLKKIAAAVMAAQEKQDMLIAKLVKADPQFPLKLRQFLHDKLQGTRGQVQAGEQTDLENITKQLESS